jgi:hypothetical protein
MGGSFCNNSNPASLGLGGYVRGLAGHRLKYRDIFERLAELLEKKTYAIETGRREEADVRRPMQRFRPSSSRGERASGWTMYMLLPMYEVHPV